MHLGRIDSTTASKDTANANLPLPFSILPILIANFKNHGLDEKDLVVLSGEHTLGFAQCPTFRNCLYNEANINPVFGKQLKSICPSNRGDSNMSPLDPTSANFDKIFFDNWVEYKGVLHSDQEFYSGGSTKELVRYYSENMEAFSSDFAQSMIKMGNPMPLTRGEIRLNCRKVNYLLVCVYISSFLFLVLCYKKKIVLLVLT